MGYVFQIFHFIKPMYMLSILIPCKAYDLTCKGLAVYLTPSHYLTSKNLHLNFIIKKR